jgi:hypothetical protein
LPSGFAGCIGARPERSTADAKFAGSTLPMKWLCTSMPE